MLSTGAAYDTPTTVMTGVLTPGQMFGSRYRVIRLLGAGGMGAVYQAWDDELAEPVALKIIRPDTLVDPATAQAVERRFKRELLLARQVTHKNVVRIHDLGEINGVKYITMPYVEGSDLATILRQSGTLDVVRALALARQIASGLLAAHEVGIVHRDLKPANIMVDADDHALITDFGIARSVSGASATALGAVVGTLEYMAPEQAMGEAADHRADIYAFGLILYDMVVGRRQASRAESAVGELMQRMKQPPATARAIDPTLPEGLDAVIMRCLEPDAAHRYQTTAALIADLDALDENGHATQALETPTRPRVTASRRRALTYSLAATLLVGTGAIGFTLWSGARAGAGDTGAVGTSGTTAATSLAILPFGNATGDPSLESLGLAIADMVRSELGRSEQLRVVPSDRVNQILRDLRITSSAAAKDPAMFRRVTEYTSASMLISGDYFKVGNRIRLTAAIHDPRRDAPVTVSAEAANESDVLSAVSGLTQSIRQNLSLPAGVVKELQSHPFAPSSKSVPALQAYSEGMALLRRGANQEALKRFEAATAADPNFALAFSRLGQTAHVLGYGRDAEKHSSRAVALSGPLPNEERHLVEGNHARITGDLDKAIAAFQSLSAAMPGDTQVQFELAKMQQEKGAFEDARTTLQKVLEKDPKYLDALLDLARVEIRSGQPQAALDPLTRALPLAIELENDETRGAILQAYGVAYWRLNKPDEAVRHYRQAMEIRERLGNQRGVADSRQAIAQVEAARGQWDAALENYRQALRLRREIGDKRGTGNLLIDLGNVHSDRGEYDEALKLFREALQIQRDVGNETYEALALNNIGTIYLSRGEYEDAQNYFERALVLREQLNVAPAVATTLHNLAETNVKLGAYDRALDRYVKALGIRRNAGDKLGTAIVLAGQSTLFTLEGRYGAALQAADEAAALIREVGAGTVWSPRVLNVQATALALLGRFGEAETTHAQALEQARQQKSDDMIARVLTMQGDTAYYQGQLAPARRLYQQAVTSAKSGVPDVAQVAAVKLAQLDLSERQPRRTLAATRDLAKANDAFVAAQAAVLAAEASLRLGPQPQAVEELRAAAARADRLGARILALQAYAALAGAAGPAPDADRARTRAREILDEIRKDARADTIMLRTDLKALAAALGS